MRTKIATIEIFQLDDDSLTAQVFEPTIMPTANIMLEAGMLPMVEADISSACFTHLLTPALEVWADKGSSLMHKLATAVKKWKGWK